jgi:hypothetical protein
MPLPVGWDLSYKIYQTLDGEEVLAYERENFQCYLTRTEDGRAADYCGFTIVVYDTYFSFDTKPSTQGTDNDGVGDSEGAEIFQKVAGIEQRYVIVHNAEIE